MFTLMNPMQNWMHCVQSKLLTVDDIGGGGGGGDAGIGEGRGRGSGSGSGSGSGGGGGSEGKAAEDSTRSGSKDGAGFKLGHGPVGSNESLQKKTRFGPKNASHMLGEIEKHMRKVNRVRWWCARMFEQWLAPHSTVISHMPVLIFG